MSEETKPSGTETSSGDRMTDADFASARERYELGTATLVELAEEYKVSRQALSKRFKNNGVKKGSRAHEVKAATGEGVKKAAEAAAAAQERFQDKRAEWIEETRLQGFQALKQARLIGQKAVVDEMKAGGSIERIDGSLKALGRYNKLLIDNLDATLRLLNSDEHIDEEDLPNLIVEDLTDEEILQHHKNTGALPEDATVEEMLADEIEIDGVS